jgi:hypothetical protein
MSSKAIILLLFLAAALVLVYLKLNHKDDAPAAPAAASSPASTSAPASPASPRTKLTVVYGTEKEAWLNASIEGFRAAHPELELELVGKGSLESAQAILDGKLTPTVWLPADSLALNLLDEDWRTKFGTPLFAKEGPSAPQPVLLTPLVLVAWEDRANALLKTGKGSLGWKTLRAAVVSNRGWPAVGGKADWGFVKLGHTDPTRSNSGLQALWSITLDYFGHGKPVSVEELLRPDYQTFLSGLERGVTKFEPSTGTFMVDMVRFGPSKYDLAVVYESLAISQIANAQGRWGDLHVYYPSLTIWSDNPAVVLEGRWVSEAQRAAGRALVAYLLGRAVQEKALGFGFRPASPDVPIKTASSDNPLVSLARYGLRPDLPPAAPAPDGAVVRNLMMLWSRLVGESARR